MNEEPFVSIILPTYNRVDWLPKSIESVLSQTYQDWELIIWDDGSTDNTTQLISSYEDKRIRFFSQKNHGKSHSLNQALRKANGKYVAFLDDDDQWLPEKLSIQIEYLQNHLEVDILFSNFVNINLANGTSNIGFNQTLEALNKLSVKKLDGQLNLIESGLLEGIFLLNFIAFDTVIMKKHVLANIEGFNEGLRNSEDTLCWTELSLRGAKFAYSEDILMKRYKPIDSLSSPSIETFQNMLKSADLSRELLIKYQREDLVQSLTPTYQSAYIGLIRQYALNGNRLAAISAFCNHFKYGFRFRSLYLFFGALLGPKIIKLVKNN